MVLLGGWEKTLGLLSVRVAVGWVKWGERHRPLAWASGEAPQVNWDWEGRTAQSGARIEGGVGRRGTQLSRDRDGREVVTAGGVGVCGEEKPGQSERDKQQ